MWKAKLLMTSLKNLANQLLFHNISYPYSTQFSYFVSIHTKGDIVCCVWSVFIMVIWQCMNTVQSSTQLLFKAVSVYKVSFIKHLVCFMSKTNFIKKHTNTAVL